MNPTLIKSGIALVPTTLLTVGSFVVRVRRKDVWSVVQFFGSAFLVIVVLTHICEALAWFPSMGFGLPHSVGHYVDLSSAVLGVTLFLAGWWKTQALW